MIGTTPTVPIARGAAKQIGGERIDAMERKHWLARRRAGIGSSDIAQVCGLSPWGGPLDVYCSKVLELPDSGSSERMEWGLLLEPVIAAAYAERTGLHVVKPKEAITQHPEHPWMLASIDYEAYAMGVAPGPFRRVAELKNSRHAEGFGEPGTDEVPVQYALQVQWQMACSGLPLADVVALVGGQELRTYPCPRDERIIEILMDIGWDFWSRVERRQPPGIDWTHPASVDLMMRLRPPEKGLVVTITDPEVAMLAAAYAALGARIGEDDRLRKQIRGRLLQAMGRAGEARLPDGTVLKASQRHKKAHEVAVSDYVELRVTRPKVKREELTYGTPTLGYQPTDDGESA